MRFEFHRLQFRFIAERSMRFTAGEAGNVLRGGFGAAFRRLVCASNCVEAKTCEVRASCRYARVFEPVAEGRGPSGLAQQPRPFVFRPGGLDGCVFAPGEPFEFGLHVFERDAAGLQSYVDALREWGRGRAALETVEQATCSIDLLARPERVESLRVDFVTPTELKAGEQVAPELRFGILLARVRDRVSTLRALYGEGPVWIDFAGFGERAARVDMRQCRLEPVHAERVSSRTGQRHGLSGLIGYAEYAGDLAEFVPFLEAAQFTGVGRHTTWGKGEIRLRY